MITREILDLMVRLEKIAQVRYAGGLAMQQDANPRAGRADRHAQRPRSSWRTTANTLRARINMLLASGQSAAVHPGSALRPIPAPAKLDYADSEDRMPPQPQLFADDAAIGSAEGKET